VHTWYNRGNKTFRVLVIKTPRPQKSTRTL
jgi:hypothetical protein